jgi:hypothetical protein
VYPVPSLPRARTITLYVAGSAIMPIWHDPRVHGEFVITLRLASGTDRGNGAGPYRFDDQPPPTRQVHQILALPHGRLPLLLTPMSDPSSPRSRTAWRGRQRAFLLTADQHRRLAALLRRGTAPRHEEQAVHHEQLADSIDRQQRQAADMRASTRSLDPAASARRDGDQIGRPSASMIPSKSASGFEP